MSTTPPLLWEDPHYHGPQVHLACIYIYIRSLQRYPHITPHLPFGTVGRTLYTIHRTQHTSPSSLINKKMQVRVVFCYFILITHFFCRTPVLYTFGLRTYTGHVSNLLVAVGGRDGQRLPAKPGIQVRHPPPRSRSQLRRNVQKQVRLFALIPLSLSVFASICYFFFSLRLVGNYVNN